MLECRSLLSSVLVAGDDNGFVDVFNPVNGVKTGTFQANFTPDDAFAVGDVNGDGNPEVLIAGDDTGVIDIFNATVGSPQFGTLLNSFNGNFTFADGFHVADLNGDGVPEVVITGDDTGMVDVFNANLNSPQFGTLISSFNGNFTFHDEFAAADVNGDGIPEVLIAGDDSGVVDIFNANLLSPQFGTLIRSFNANYTEYDGFAVGDVDGNGVNEIVIAGDVNHIVDIFNADFTSNGFGMR
jgi:hypothetical protein